MKSKTTALHLYLSLWVVVSVLTTFTYQFQSDDLGEYSKTQDLEPELADPKLTPDDDEDEDPENAKVEFMTSTARLASQEEYTNEPKTAEGPEHDGVVLNDESQPSPNSLDENTVNSSINSNQTQNNETKPTRTVAFCSLHPDLRDTTSEGTPTLPVLPEDSSLNNETMLLDSGSVESSSSAEDFPYIEPKTDLEPLVSRASSVRLVNMSELVQDVLWSNNSVKSRVIPANCSIVLFYASWCQFSAKAAPHFNALPRAFPSLRVVAIDVSSQTSVNSYFGILSVPTVILFHNGKSIAKFNESSFSLNKFAEFVHTHTDLRSDENINVTSQDFLGPLPSVPTRAIDVYLVFAWIFISTCFFYYVTKSALWRRAIDLVRTTWREAEDHVHQD